MTSRNKLACYLMVGFVIWLGCVKAQAESKPDKILAADLLTVKEPGSQAESRLRVIRLTTLSGATGYGDYLDFGLPTENEVETLARLVNRYGAQGYKQNIFLTDPSIRAVGSGHTVLGQTANDVLNAKTREWPGRAMYHRDGFGSMWQGPEKSGLIIALGTAISAPSIPRSRVGLPLTTTSKNNDERIVMAHQVRSNQPNRRNFLKQSALGAGALAGLPSLGQPLLAADSGSRIEALELLVLKQNSERRRVLKVISSTGAAGYADFPDLDYAPALGGVAKNHLIGANPFAVEAIWSTMRRAGVLCSHRTAVDYALWDLLGRETGKPVYELLGGPVRDRIRIYYYGKPPKQQLENEGAWRALGRKLATQPGAVVKVDPWLVFERFGDRKVWENTVYEAGGRMPTQENIAYNEMVFRCLREGAGDKLDLIHGGHGQCSAEGAIATCKPLEPYDLLWIEEPVTPTSSMDEMAKVAAATTVPIATGENLQGLEDFTRLIDKRAASVLNLSPPNVGGLTEARKIAALAEIRGMQIAPHFFSYGPLCWVAMANLCMATPNVLILEANSLRENPSGPKSLNKNPFFKEPIKIDGYYFEPSGKPGLGYEYDEKFVVSRKRLA